MPERDECSRARERCQFQFGVDFPVVRSISSGGTRGVGRPYGSFGTSNVMGTPGATPPWRAMRSGCAKRRGCSHASSAQATHSLPRVMEVQPQPLTTRRATQLVLKRPGQRTNADTQLIAQLQAQHHELAAANELAQDFCAMVRARHPDRFDHWLACAVAGGVAPLRRFAAGLRADYDAVKAGMMLPWSNGPVEGHINRLKMLKRSMFGRAKIDLLSRQFLLAARYLPWRRLQANGGDLGASARGLLSSKGPAFDAVLGTREAEARILELASQALNNHQICVKPGIRVETGRCNQADAPM